MPIYLARIPAIINEVAETLHVIKAAYQLD